MSDGNDDEKGFQDESEYKLSSDPEEIKERAIEMLEHALEKVRKGEYEAMALVALTDNPPTSYLGTFGNEEIIPEMLKNAIEHFNEITRMH